MKIMLFTRIDDRMTINQANWTILTSNERYDHTLSNDAKINKIKQFMTKLHANSVNILGFEKLNSVKYIQKGWINDIINVSNNLRITF